MIDKKQYIQKKELKKNFNKETTELSISIDEIKINDNINFMYKVKNKSQREISLQFGTSQRYDYEITNEVGQIIYQYSVGKSFLQALSTISLKPDEVLEYQIKSPELESGNYKLSVSLLAKDFSVKKKTIDFTIE